MPSTTANSTSGTGAAGAAITPSLSTLTVENWLVLLVAQNSGTVAVPTPAGWTAVPSTANTQNPSGTSSDRSIAAFTKLIASATETASLTTSGAYQWTMFEVANTSGPTASSGNTGAVTTAGANPTTNSGAGVATNDLIIAYVMTMTTASTFTAGTGYTAIPSVAPSTANLSSRAETKTATGSGATAAAFVNASTTLWSELVFSMAPAVFTKQAAETATAAGTPGRVFGGTRNDTSTVNVISDTPGRVQALLRGLSQTALATDVVAGVKALLRQGTETTLATDSDRTGLTYEQQVLLDTPLAFYRFDLETGASDISGNGRHATYSGGSDNGSSPIRDEHGSRYTNNALIATYAGGAGLPSGAAARTVEAWIRVPAGSTFPQNPVAYGTGSGTTYRLRFHDAIGIGFADANGTLLWTVPSITDDIWHQYVLTYDGGTTMELFIDGASQGAKTLGVPLSTTLASLSLGGDGDFLWPGYMGNVAIYSSVLSADRIIRHYRAGISLTRAILRDQPLAYWRLGDVSASNGSTILDSSVNGINGTYGGQTAGQSGVPMDEGTTSVSFGFSATESNAPATTLISGNNPWTVECCFRRTGVPDAYALWNQHGPGGASDSALHLVADNPNTLSVGYPAGSDFSAGWAVPAINDGVWHHVALTYSSGTFHLFLDGIDYGPATAAGSLTIASTGSFAIGAWGLNFWNGYLEEVAVYNKALTAKQVQDRWVAMSGSPVMRWIEAPSETGAITDVPGRVAVMTRPLTATVLTSGAVSGPRALLRVATDALSALDSVARSFVGSRAASQTSTATDSPARLQALLRALLETAIGTDAANRGFGGSRQDVETASTSDTVSRAAASLRAALETATTTDAVNRSLATARRATDTETLTDTATRAVVLLRAALHTATSTDTDAAARALLRQTTEQVTTLDSALRALALSRSSIETGTASDTTARLTAEVRSALDTITTSDVVSRALAMTRQDAESTTASDSPNRILGALRQVAETILSSDAVSAIKVLGGVTWTIVVSETASVTAAAQRLFSGRRQDTEHASTADSPNRLASSLRSALDTVVGTETVQRILTLTRTGTDTISNTDAPGAPRGVLRTAFETIVTTDQAGRAYGAARTTVEAIVASDAITRRLDALRIAVGNSATLDIAQRGLGKLAQAADALLTSDAAARSRGLAVSAQEAISNSETLGRIGSWLRDAADRVGILDVVSAIYHRFVSPGSIDIALRQPSTITLALSMPSAIHPSLVASSTIAVIAKRPSTIEIAVRPL